MNPSDGPETKRLAVCLALAPALAVPLLISFLYSFPLVGSLPGRCLYALGKLFAAGWPLLATGLILKAGLPRPRLKDPRHWKALLPGVLVGAAMLAALGIAVLLLERAAAGAIPTLPAGAGETIPRRFYWPLAVGFCLFHPAVDEYYWRWFVFGSLRRLLDRRAAHLLAAAVFGAHHVVTSAAFLGPAKALLVGAVSAAAGLVWSLLYDRQQTLGGAWASHFVLEMGIAVLFHRVLFGSWA